MHGIKVYLVILGHNETQTGLLLGLDNKLQIPSSLVYEGQKTHEVAFNLARKVIAAAPSWYDVMPVIFADTSEKDKCVSLIYRVLLNKRVKLAEGWYWTPFEEVTKKAIPDNLFILNLGTQDIKHG